MSSSPIVELLGSPQVVVGFGATTLVLLATTFFYLKKNNEGSNGRGAASSSSALEKAEELDSEVRRLFDCRSMKIQCFTQDMLTFFIPSFSVCDDFYLYRNIPEDTSQSTTALKPAQPKCSPNK